MKKLALLAVVALGLAAVAATQYTRILHLQVSGKTLLGSTVESNAIDNTVVADVDWDFGNLSTTCADSAAYTATGVKVGDPCFVAVGPRDGGSIVASTNAVFQARVTATDTVILRMCPAGTATNPDDAGYVVRCISSP